MRRWAVLLAVIGCERAAPERLSRAAAPMEKESLDEGKMAVPQGRAEGLSAVGGLSGLRGDVASLGVLGSIRGFRDVNEVLREADITLLRGASRQGRSGSVLR